MTTRANRVQLTSLQSEMLGALKAVSRTTTFLLVASLVLSVYLVQRGLNVFSFASPYLQFRGDAGAGLQVDWLGLKVTYMSMTVLWPGVLGALCLGFSHSASKQLLIWTRLSTEQPQLAQMLPLLDPYGVTPSKLRMRGAKMAWAIVAVAPAIALVFHVVASVFGTVWLLCSSPWPEKVVWLSFGAYVAVFLLAVCLCIWGSASFRRSTARLSRAFDEQ